MVSRIGRSLKTRFRSAVIKRVAALWEKRGGGAFAFASVDEINKQRSCLKALKALKALGACKALIAKGYSGDKRTFPYQ